MGSKNIRRALNVFVCVVGLVLVGLPVIAFSQSERLHTSGAATTSVGRGAPVIEKTKVVNTVNVSVRHCLKYMRDGVVDAVACAMDQSTLFYSHTDHNLRTNAGSDAQSSQMGNTSTQAASCNYIALSNDATAPSASDTTLASEIATNGLSRAQGTYAHTSGTASFTIQKVFSATGTQASQKTGLFNASSSGTLCFENTYTQVTVNNGDTLTVTWTINI